MIGLALLLGTLPAREVHLTGQGAIVMALCVGLVLGLNIFCMSHILRERPPQGHDGASSYADTREAER